MDHNIDTSKFIGKRVGEIILHYLSASRKMDSKDNNIFVGKCMYNIVGN